MIEVVFCYSSRGERRERKETGFLECGRGLYMIIEGGNGGQVDVIGKYAGWLWLARVCDAVVCRVVVAGTCL